MSVPACKVVFAKTGWTIYIPGRKTWISNFVTDAAQVHVFDPANPQTRLEHVISALRDALSTQQPLGKAAPVLFDVLGHHDFDLLTTISQRAWVDTVQFPVRLNRGDVLVLSSSDPMHS